MSNISYRKNKNKSKTKKKVLSNSPIEIGKKLGETTFVNLEIDVDEATKATITAYGCEKFNELPDEVLEQVMFEYGFTQAIKNSIEERNGKEYVDPSNPTNAPAPIAVQQERYEREEAKRLAAIPKLEFSELAEMIISTFLKAPSSSALNLMGFFNADDWAEERRYSYLKMSRAQRIKWLDKWGEDLVNKFKQTKEIINKRSDVYGE